jgi:hypothetical protein
MIADWHNAIKNINQNNVGLKHLSNYYNEYFYVQYDKFNIYFQKVF